MGPEFVNLLAQVKSTGMAKVTRFKWLGMPEAWIVVLVVMAVVALTWLIYRRETGIAGPAAKIFLGTVRVLIVLLVLFVLFEPVISTEMSEVRESYVVVLIDESLSMSFKDTYSDAGVATALSDAVNVSGQGLSDMSRLDIVRTILAREDVDLANRLLEKNSLKVFTFSSGIRLFGEGHKKSKFMLAAGGTNVEAQADPFEALEAKGAETKLGDSLNEALSFLKGQRIAGVVVISDGRNNRGMLKPEEVADAAGLKNVPFYTVGVGDPEEPKDIVLANLEAREVVLVNDKVTFNFMIRSRGYESENITATLRFGDEVKQSKQIKLLGNNQVQRESLSHTPDKQGEFEVIIELTIKPDEQFKENNKLTHQLKVVDEKIKVLYVDCYPRWEYRYLKNALVRDDTMKVQCLLQSADEGFPQESSSGVEPLSQFPVTKTELFENYHVILLGDIDPSHPRQPISIEQMKWIKEFVQKMHGGVLFMVGENFTPDCFRDTPLQDLVPVISELRAGEVWRWSEAKTKTFHVKLTPEGREHSIMRLTSDRLANIELWEDNDRREANSLPGFYWYYRAKKPKPGAVVLASHPEDSNDKGDRRPLVAYMNTGGGDTMFVGVDSTWRWRAGVGDIYFYRFWSQAIRFLSTRILLGKTKHHTVTTDKPSYLLGEQVNITARVLDRDFTPKTQEKQPVNLRYPDGTDETFELTLNPNNPGTYTGSVNARHLGWHKLWIGTGAEDPEKGMAFTTFNVEVPVLERKDPRMNKELLKLMATLSKGKYFEIYELDKVPDAVEEIIETIDTEVSEDRLWDKSWVMVLFVALLACEWIGRKLRKLV